MTNDLTITLKNLQGTSAPISTTLFEPVNADKNVFILTAKNRSTDSITFSGGETAFTLTNERAVPEISLSQATLTAASQGRWHLKTDSQDSASKALIPDEAVSLSAGDSLSFTLASLALTQDALASSDAQAFGQLKVAHQAGEAQSFALYLGTYAAQPKTPHLGLAFYQPPDWTWNVQQGSETDSPLVPDKQADAVYANTITNLTLKTRLGFHLINYDHLDDLVIPASTKLILNFMSGSGESALASKDVLKKISIEGPLGWQITPPQTSSDAPSWTLQPTAKVTLKRDRPIFFEIRGIQANNTPGNTEMQISYPKFSSYEAGYIAATITKVPPQPQILSVAASPAPDAKTGLYKIDENITLKWQAFAVDVSQLKLGHKSPGASTYQTSALSSLVGEITLKRLIASGQRTTLYQVQVQGASLKSPELAITREAVLSLLFPPAYYRVSTTNTTSAKHVTKHSGGVDLPISLKVSKLSIAFLSAHLVVVEVSLYVHLAMAEDNGSRTVDTIWDSKTTVRLSGTWSMVGHPTSSLQIKIENLIWPKFDLPNKSKHLLPQEVKSHLRTVNRTGSITLPVDIATPSALTVTASDPIQLYLDGSFQGHKIKEQPFDVPLVKKGWKLLLNSVHIITKVKSNMVLDIKGSEATDGARLQISLLTQTDSQSWQLISLNNGYYQIVSALNPNYALASVSASYIDNQTQELRLKKKDADAQEQQWLVKHVKGDDYKIVCRYYLPVNSNSDSARIISLADTYPSDGVSVDLKPWLNLDNQKWALKSAT